MIDIDQGLPDLQVLFRDTIKLPDDYLTGGGKRLTLPLDILNVDTAGPDQVTLPVARQTKITIKLYVRPEGAAADGSDDIEVGVLEKVNVGGLPIGRVRRANAHVTLPSTVATGNVQFIAHIDPENKVRELNEDPEAALPQANNLAASALFGVTQGLPDLIATVPTHRSIPEQVISADGRTYRLPIRVTNQGNLAVPPDLVTSVTVTLSSIDGTDSLELETIGGIEVGDLRPGRSANLHTLVNFINSVNDFPNEVDQQHFIVEVDPADAITEHDELNNQGFSKTVDVTLGAPEISFDIKN